MNSNNVVIIGAGLSGLTLALALHKQSIPCTIHEARSASLDIGGAIMLSPNALRILDTLGIYEKIRSRGFEFTDLYFYTDKPLDFYEFGDREKYQYDALANLPPRIERRASCLNQRERNPNRVRQEIHSSPDRV